LLPGITYGPTPALDAATIRELEIGAVLADGASSSESENPGSPIAASAAAQESSTRADALALLRADKIANLAALLGRWFVPRAGQNPDAESEAGGDPAAGEMVAQAERIEGNGDLKADRVERAELGVPTSLLLVSMAAYRLRQLAARWWRRSSRNGPTETRRPKHRLIAHPRSFQRKSRTVSAARVLRQS
jgi:hypothetical protein